MFKKILLPVDLNHESSWKAALPKAIEMTKAFGSELHLVAVVPDFGMAMVGEFFPPDFEEKALRKAEAELEKFAKDHVPEGPQHELHLAHGSASDQILKMADKLDVDLILMASHRPDLFQDFLVGSNADRIVHHSPVSVLIVRDESS